MGTTAGLEIDSFNQHGAKSAWCNHRKEQIVQSRIHEAFPLGNEHSKMYRRFPMEKSSWMENNAEVIGKCNYCVFAASSASTPSSTER